MKEVYIGIDAHKDSNTLAYAFAGRDEPRLVGKVSADLNRTLDALRRFQKKHDLAKERLHICYEAGPTGFTLVRRLLGLGYDCIVVAPSKIPSKSGDPWLASLARMPRILSNAVPQLNTVSPRAHTEVLVLLC